MEELRLTKELRTLTIDPEFRDLIPPLAEDEHRLLEDSIVANGCESPLFVWDGIIVDGHNRYEICQKHGVPFAVVEKDFADRDAALMWIITTQLGRRNLTTYQKGELALKFEPLMKKEAKERQGQRTDLINIPKNSAESSVDAMKALAKERQGRRTDLSNNIPPMLAGSSPERGDSRDALGKVAGVSHGTLQKVKKLADAADDETKQKLRRGDVSINKAYNELMQKEHDGETKVCERCHEEKPVSDFHIPSNRHGFSALCKQCESEVDKAAKAAAEVAAQTTEPVETQPMPAPIPAPAPCPISGMVMYKGAPIHVRTALPDEPGMFEHIIDLVQFASDAFLANIKTAMELYTRGMASEANTEAIINLLDNTADTAEEMVDNRIKEMYSK